MLNSLILLAEYAGTPYSKLLIISESSFALRIFLLRELHFICWNALKWFGVFCFLISQSYPVTSHHLWKSLLSWLLHWSSILCHTGLRDPSLIKTTKDREQICYSIQSVPCVNDRKCYARPTVFFITSLVLVKLIKVNVQSAAGPCQSSWPAQVFITEWGNWEQEELNLSWSERKNFPLPDDIFPAEVKRQENV